jgi:hypothetical protein
MNKRRFLSLCGAFGGLAAAPAWGLYDPPPDALLAAGVGAWRGTLTYRDYQNPDRMVTLPTRVSGALISPDELALYYVYDDGPGKTVYSYERLRLDVAAKRLTSLSGVSKPGSTDYMVTLLEAGAQGAQLNYERLVDDGVDHFEWRLTPRTWLLTKREVRSGRDDVVRSRYEFTRDAG